MVIGFLSAFLITLMTLVALIIYCCLKKLCKRKQKQNGNGNGSQDPAVSSSVKDSASCASFDTDSERELFSAESSVEKDKKKKERTRVQDLSMQSMGVVKGSLFRGRRGGIKSKECTV